MKILITGGAGFIGSHIAEDYAERGHMVLCLDDYSREGWAIRMKYLEKDLAFKYPVEFQECDIRYLSHINEAISTFQPDVVFHCAGQTGAVTSIDIPHQDFLTNAVGTMNLLESIRNAKCDPAIVFCSTNKIFGQLPTITPTNEQLRADIMPKTPYGISKTVGDFYMQEYAHLYGLKTGIFRMSCIYGERQFGIESQGWIAHFVISAIKDKMITIFGDGNQLRDVLHVSDLVRAFDNFVEKADDLKGDIFCMGGGPENVLSLHGLVIILERLLERNVKCQYDKVRPVDQQFYISDIRKAMTFLNWLPTIKPYHGIEMLVRWVQKNINHF
jgi:CDP-paratose 2-epimerase